MLDKKTETIIDGFILEERSILKEPTDRVEEQCAKYCLEILLDLKQELKSAKTPLPNPNGLTQAQWNHLQSL